MKLWTGVEEVKRLRSFFERVKIIQRQGAWFRLKEVSAKFSAAEANLNVLCQWGFPSRLQPHNEFRFSPFSTTSGRLCSFVSIYFVSSTGPPKLSRPDRLLQASDAY